MPLNCNFLQSGPTLTKIAGFRSPLNPMRIRNTGRRNRDDVRFFLPYAIIPDAKCTSTKPAENSTTFSSVKLICVQYYKAFMTQQQAVKKFSLCALVFLHRSTMLLKVRMYLLIHNTDENVRCCVVFFFAKLDLEL